jgi:hypothetical protein
MYNKELIENVQDENVLDQYSHTFSRKHWEIISRSCVISEEFMDKYWDKLVPRYLAFNQNMSEDFIRKHLDDFSWEAISLGQAYGLTEKFIDDYHDKLVWEDLCYYCKMTESIMRRYSHLLHWEYVSSEQALSEEFIEDFKDKINWTSFSSCGKYSLLGEYPEDFFRKYVNRLNWKRLPSFVYCKLSEEFLDEYKDYVDFEMVSRYCYLSEGFIRRHSTVLDWNYICQTQSLSNEFMDEFYEYLWFDYIFQDQVTSEDFIEKYCTENSHWLYVFSHQELSEPFILRHLDKLGNDLVPFFRNYLISDEVKEKVKFMKDLGNL